MLDFLQKVHAFIGRLGGKRFVVATGAVAAILLSSLLGWNEQTVNTWINYAITYIFAQSVADKVTDGATSSNG